MTDGGPPWVVIGEVAGVFGVRGEVKIRPLTAEPETPLSFPVWWLGRDEKHLREVALERGRPHQRGLVAKLVGWDDRDLAAALVGELLHVPRSALPEPDDDEHYWMDLQGCHVVGPEGQDLGVVDHLFATGANDVLVLTAPDGSERLLPYIAEVVREVDLEARIIRVSPLPGM